MCVHTGQVNLKVSAEALKTDILCGNEVATVPDMGRIDTVVRTLLVEVSDCQMQHKTAERLSLSTNKDIYTCFFYESNL